MNYRFLTFFIVLALVASTFAQSVQKTDIKGYVRDSKSGEALPYANISIEGTSRGSTTNTDGYFIIVNEPLGTKALTVRYIGYTPVRVELDVQPKSEALQIELNPTVLEVEGITVTAQADMLEASDQVSQMTISPRQLSSLPSIGEVDVFRTMQLLPGVSGVSDGSSDGAVAGLVRRLVCWCVVCGCVCRFVRRRVRRCVCWCVSWIG